MAIEINFENNYRGVLLQACDNLSGEELVAITEQIYSFDRDCKVAYQIFDISHIHNIDIDLPTIRYIAHLDQCAAQKRGGMKIAVVVKPGVLETLSQAWAEFGNSPFLHTKICLDMPTARSWIAQADLEAMV